tara:strand:+ start:620 stop:733 length:114 start_codon:yes stop_codon:yes gene_type:complete
MVEQVLISLVQVLMVQDMDQVEEEVLKAVVETVAQLE